MNSYRYLTKSRFKLAVECPTKLFYTGKRAEYHDTMADNDFLAMLAEGGYQVGALAKLRYPEGIEITVRGHDATEADTRKYLEQENVILFEPAIRVGNFYIRIDILIKRGNRFELIEVKAKSYDSHEPGIEGKRGGIQGGMLPYIQDAAFQTWVLKQAFPQAEISTFLLMPDKARTGYIDGINQMFKIREDGEVELRIPDDVCAKTLAESLLVKVCVDKYVEQVIATPLEFPGGPLQLEEAAVAWAESYRLDQKIAPVIGAHCGGCQFKTSLTDGLKSGFHECWRVATGWKEADFKDGLVLDLWNFRSKQKLIDQGVLKISQVRRDDLGDFPDDPDAYGLSRSQRQWLQVNGIPAAYDHGGFYFDDGYVSAEMANWSFPYHFIDFETSAVALPFYKNMRPYEAVAFQFSHHVMEADGSIRHAGQFLCVEPGKFPNYAFVRELRNQLAGDQGSVFMWSHHENTILTSILNQLATDPDGPDDKEGLISFIRSIIKIGDRAMIDLCTIAEKAFFHPDTKGSNSIKQVLPAILKVSGMLQRTYSSPVYGALHGIPSFNYASSEGFVWIDLKQDGIPDPYERLKELARAELPEGVTDDSVIAQGGAAATAYARLQFEDLNQSARERIKSSLLRYCELDTLAMVMVVQAWRDLVNHEDEIEKLRANG